MQIDKLFQKSIAKEKPIKISSLESYDIQGADFDKLSYYTPIGRIDASKHSVQIIIVLLINYFLIKTIATQTAPSHSEYSPPV